MRVIADLCVTPIGVGTSVSEYVAACQRVLRDAGLEPLMHAYGSNVEGEWETVFGALQRCHEVVHEMGAPPHLDQRPPRDPDRPRPDHAG